jgi:hypothetical protein
VLFFLTLVSLTKTTGGGVVFHAIHTGISPCG